MITIRPEQPEDIVAVRKINETVFDQPTVSSGGRVLSLGGLKLW